MIEDKVLKMLDTYLNNQQSHLILMRISLFSLAKDYRACKMKSVPFAIKIISQILKDKPLMYSETSIIVELMSRRVLVSTARVAIQVITM